MYIFVQDEAMCFQGSITIPLEYKFVQTFTIELKFFCGNSIATVNFAT